MFIVSEDNGNLNYDITFNSGMIFYMVKHHV